MNNDTANHFFQFWNSLPDGLWIICLLPLFLLLEWIFCLAFLRRAQVYLGELNDTSHRFGVVKGGLFKTQDQTPAKIDNGRRGAIRMGEQGWAEVSVDFKGDGTMTPIGLIGSSMLHQSDQQESTDASTHPLAELPPSGTEPVPVIRIPDRGERTWRDLWMGARTDHPDMHFWVRETGLLFRSQAVADKIALAPRGAALLYFYRERGESIEETPMGVSRGFWDLLLPGAFVFLCLYNWLLVSGLSVPWLYLTYLAIVTVLWGTAVWLDSIMSDRVAKWLHLFNRNTGLVRWNAFVLILSAAIFFIGIFGKKYDLLPLALVCGISVAVTWLKAPSGPWRVLPPNKQESPGES